MRHSVEAEAHHLHRLEVEGESPATPLVAILEVALFLLPIVVLVMAVSFLAGHFFG
jgi:hypothetical protein